METAPLASPSLTQVAGMVPDSGAAARARLAFFPHGPITLELIEPIEGPSTWRDQLEQPGPSLHHMAFEVKGMAGLLPVLAEHGLPLVQGGDYTGGRYACLDGLARFGAEIELLEND